MFRKYAPPGYIKVQRCRKYLEVTKYLTASREKSYGEYCTGTVLLHPDRPVCGSPASFLSGMESIMADPYHCCTRWTIAGLCVVLVLFGTASAFTANSLDITVDKSGDATAVFTFTLDGVIENAIPQSVLEEQLVNGLGSSSDPPTLISMDRSSASLLMKNFAGVNNVSEGLEYQTGSMDFKKADIALKNSAVSAVISADFSPSRITVTFPDKYARTFSNVDALPALTHTVVDPAKAAAAAQAATRGALQVTATPVDAEVWIDGVYQGNAPSTFSDLAPGSHALEFKKSGYSPAKKTVNVTAGKTLKVSAVLALDTSTIAPTNPASPGFGGIATGAALILGVVLLAVARRNDP